MLAGNNEEVDRRLRPHVLESDYRLIFVHNLSGSLSLNNAAEDAVFHRAY